MDRNIIKEAFFQSGLSCDVAEASDLDEAIEACKTQYFDCAFLDYHMPGKSGLEGVSRLKADHPFMAVVMATGYGDETLASSAIKNGAEDYISKSAISSRSVRRVVENAIENVHLKKKLEEQRRALESFSRVLVHDLKAPIRHIMIHSDFVQEDLIVNNFRDLKSHCKLIKEAGLYLEGFVETLAKYNHTLLDTVEFSPTSMQKALENAINFLSDQIKTSNAQVTFDPLPMVNGNLTELIQLMQNLVSNAIKYCKAEVPRVHVSVQSYGSFWRFKVQDNGIGIAHKDWKCIFEPLKRLHHKSQYSGYGLGLASCRQIVERHGGHIWCESSDSGSSFFIELRKLTTN